jgi:hypothetical protein
MQATAAIIGDLTGATVATTALGYLGNCISLGRRDAILQAVDGDARSKPWSWRGRQTARFKAFVLNGAAWNQSHPTYGLPVRRRRLGTVPDPASAAVAG